MEKGRENNPALAALFRFSTPTLAALLAMTEGNSSLFSICSIFRASPCARTSSDTATGVGLLQHHLGNTCRVLRIAQ